MGCLKKPKKPEARKATEQEKELLKQSEEQWRFYKQNYVPLESAQIKRVGEMDSKGEMAEAEALMVSQAKQNIPMTSGAALQPGTVSGSGGHIMRATALERMHGGAMGNAAMLSEQAQHDRRVQARQRLIDFGSGQDSLAGSVTGRAAGLAASVENANVTAGNAQSAFNHNSSMDFAGTMVGAASHFAPQLKGAAQAMGSWGSTQTSGGAGGSAFNWSGTGVS